MFQNTSKLEPSPSNSPIGNIPQFSKISYGDNTANNQSYHSSDRPEFKSINYEDYHARRVSLKSPKINEAELLKIIKDNHNKYLPEATNEVIDNINQIKDYKWKLGVILNDKINF